MIRAFPAKRHLSSHRIAAVIAAASLGSVLTALAFAFRER